MTIHRNDIGASINQYRYFNTINRSASDVFSIQIEGYRHLGFFTYGVGVGNCS